MELTQQNVTEIQANQIADFVYSEIKYDLPKNTYVEYVKKHLLYKTCVIIYDFNGIVAFARFNVIDNAKRFNILEAIIRKDKRWYGLMKNMIEKGLSLYPNVEYISFERGQRNMDRGFRVYKIKEFLRRDL
jgi:hypothetical protein